MDAAALYRILAHVRDSNECLFRNTCRNTKKTLKIVRICANEQTCKQVSVHANIEWLYHKFHKTNFQLTMSAVILDSR